MSDKRFPVVEVITATVEIEVRDRQGRVIERRKEQPSRSPVRAFLEAFLSMVIGAAVPTVDTGGAADNVGPTTATLLTATGPANDATQGIVVGTGVTAIDIADDSLTTQIAEGTGSGQLTHNLQTMDSQVETGTGQAWFDITRTFTNGSGATIKVYEMGIYAVNGQAAADDVCLMHDVITPVYVPDGATLTIRYRMRIVL